jgi:hypothetical protein
MAEKTKDHHEFIPEAAVKHARAARAEMRKSFAEILPPGFIEHRKKARLEMLRAAREIINHTLERLESDTENDDE